MSSVPEKRTAKAEQTRAGIVDAAMRLFRENGYDATTMRAIADEAGVSLGSAYYYFSGKEELFALTLVGYLDELESRLNPKKVANRLIGKAQDSYNDDPTPWMAAAAGVAVLLVGGIALAIFGRK